MSNKRIIFLVFLFIVLANNLFANNMVNFTLEITGININEGQIYVKIYSNDRDYKNDIAYASYVLESTSQRIVYKFDILESQE